MTAFPSSIIPSTRTYSPGACPHTVHGVYDGSESRVRHSNTVLGVRLRLFFPAITTAELLTVIGHYAGQSGRFLPFAIPDDLLSGVTTPADFTPAGHQWRYAARPTVEDISIVGGTNRHNLTIELETVPPENTIAQGARLRVRSSLQAGSAQLGAFFDVYAWLDAGAGSAADPFLVTATLTAGAASAGGGSDPDFASVSVLLPMNGTNGSTTFTDASSNALTVTANGNAQISTAQNKWGGASGSFDGTGDYLSIPANTAFDLGAGDYTIELWIYCVSAADYGGLVGKGAVGTIDSSIYSIEFNNTSNAVSFYVGSVGAYIVAGTTNVRTAAAWRHVAVCRSGSNTRLFVGGTQEGSTYTSGYTIASGNSLYVGGGFYAPSSNTINGYIDDLRITKGVARYTASFTPPAAAFPTS
jgi:hypothetical protein